MDRAGEMLRPTIRQPKPIHKPSRNQAITPPLLTKTRSRRPNNCLHPRYTKDNRRQGNQRQGNRCLVRLAVKWFNRDPMGLSQDSRSPERSRPVSWALQAQ